MSATEVLVNPNLPPAKPNLSFTRKPASPLAQFFWRRRMWFESTFAFSVLEPWEKILLLTIFAFFYTLVLIAMLKYLPHHLVFLHRRAMYYLFGRDTDVTAKTSVMLINEASSGRVRLGM